MCLHSAWVLVVLGARCALCEGLGYCYVAQLQAGLEGTERARAACRRVLGRVAWGWETHDKPVTAKPKGFQVLVTYCLPLSPHRCGHRYMDAGKQRSLLRR